MRTYEDGYNQAYKDYNEERKHKSKEDALVKLWNSFAWGLVGFQCKGKKEYKVIKTRYDRGYEQALKEIEGEENEKID